MSTYVWSDVLERATAGFAGERPAAQTEMDLLEAFKNEPAMVSAAVESAIQDFQAGRVTSGWGVLRARVRKHQEAEAIIVTDESERRRAIKHVEQWVRAAGKHFDTQAEIEDELFGDMGRLRRWRGDLALRTRMLALWGDVRSEGELIEAEAEERAERWKAIRAGERKIEIEYEDIPF